VSGASNGLFANTPQELALERPARGMRFELLVVMAVAVLPAVVSSARSAMTPETSPFTRADLVAVVFSGVRQSLVGLLLVVYVAYQRGESLRHFGWRIRPAVIPASLVLGVAAMAAYSVVRLIVYLARFDDFERLGGPPDDAIPADTGALWLLMVIVAPVFEETVVRAYLMTRLRDLELSPVWCVLGSTLVQMSYHLHAGLVFAPAYAAIFLVFSLYFVRYRNLPVVILAHFYIDIVWWAVR